MSMQSGTAPGRHAQNVFRVLKLISCLSAFSPALHFSEADGDTIVRALMTPPPDSAASAVCNQPLATVQFPG
jgi:hypothetical protein